MGYIALAVGIGLVLGLGFSAWAAATYLKNDEKKPAKNAAVENEQQTAEFVKAETETATKVVANTAISTKSSEKNIEENLEK